MSFIDTEKQTDKIDIEIREYLEHHELPQWFVDEIANKYLNVTYIRKRIREIYPQFLREISPYLEFHKQ